MPCQASAKTGVIVAQLCWYTVPYVSSSYEAAYTPAAPAMCMRGTHVCAHSDGSTSEAAKEVRRWASTPAVAGMMRNIHRD